jgi:hypothetical protein
MALFRRKTTSRPDRPSTPVRRGAVSVSVSGQSRPYADASTAGAAAAAAPPPKPLVERYEGTTIEPADTAALRINSAADVDPNVKKYGDDGVFKGGAGGYGGAGTK